MRSLYSCTPGIFVSDLSFFNPASELYSASTRGPQQIYVCWWFAISILYSCRRECCCLYPCQQGVFVGELSYLLTEFQSCILPPLGFPTDVCLLMVRRAQFILVQTRSVWGCLPIFSFNQASEKNSTSTLGFQQVYVRWWFALHSLYSCQQGVWLVILPFLLIES